MRHLPLRGTAALLAAIACAAVPAPVFAAEPGGAAAPGGGPAPSTGRAGGSAYGVPARVSAGGPVLLSLSVPRTAVAGRPPTVKLSLDETGVATVTARVTITDLASHTTAVSAALGWVRTRRTVTVHWPSGAVLRVGSYEVSVRAHDHQRRQLLRGARTSGVVGLTVAEPPAPQPTPAAPPPAAEPGVPTPAQSAAAGAVFPVAGPHSFGGPENRFGAPRGNHTHQGQDILTAEGTPDVAPMAGTVTWTSYQAGGAGYYAVEHTSSGFDFMFAHCQAGSLAVSPEQAMSAGQRICSAGQTGDATTPHLHFEMWVGGWQAATGHPIDPLPYLEAWDHAGAG